MSVIHLHLEIIYQTFDYLNIIEFFSLKYLTNYLFVFRTNFLGFNKYDPY